MSHEALRAEMRAAVDQLSRLRPVQPEIWDRLARGIYYVPAAFEDPAGYATLGKQLTEVEARYGTCGNRMYYLATPQGSYTSVVAQLGEAKLVSESWPDLSSTDWPCWSRVIVEKPFGRDLTTAAALNVEIHKVFHDTQVYRIDHYLGKETVQNILTFRLATASSSGYGTGDTWIMCRCSLRRSRGRGTRRILRHGRRGAGHGAEPHACHPST